jgi:hypothetical protein
MELEEYLIFIKNQSLDSISLYLECCISTFYNQKSAAEITIEAVNHRKDTK